MVIATENVGQFAVHTHMPHSVQKGGRKKMRHDVKKDIMCSMTSKSSS